MGTIVYLEGVIDAGREGIYKRIIEEDCDTPLDLTTEINANFIVL